MYQVGSVHTLAFTFSCPCVGVLRSDVFIRFSIDSSRLIRGKSSSLIWDNSNSGSPVGLLFDFVHCESGGMVGSRPCFLKESTQGWNTNQNDQVNGYLFIILWYLFSLLSLIRVSSLNGWYVSQVLLITECNATFTK